MEQRRPPQIAPVLVEKVEGIEGERASAAA
jgi:hypothetical protein